MRSEVGLAAIRNVIRRSRLALIALLVAASPTRGQDAQIWPSRPLTMVIPFAAGGPTDVLGRVLAQRLVELLGQQVIVENIAGAGGTTGAARVAKAAPDGYQVVLGNIATHAYSQTLYKKPLYDAAADFAPVGLVAGGPWVLVTRKDLPVATLPELVAYAKANQRSMQYGSAGVGSGTHITCVLLNMAMGTDITHVPYRGSGPAMQDLIAGRIDFVCDVVSNALPQIEAGGVKAIATLGESRVAVLPNLPTAGEQGLGAFDGNGWNALFLPRGTAAEIIARLSRAASEAQDTPWVRTRLEGLGLRVPPPEQRNPAYLAALVPREIARWAAPIRASGASAD
ncbi:MAG: tripartite tricarboxylate transporter substrate binding protein BugD [Hyphomicrobiales bacterium]|nr:tripartite tricarboxylate transporter substrate binding protein BugD [Hyphomicrobiales bacterium]